MAALLRLFVLLALAAIAVGCGAVSEAGEDDRSLERYGIRIEVPERWDARLTRGTVEATLGDDELVLRIFEFEPSPDFHTAEFEQAYADGDPRPFTAEEFGPPEFGSDESGADKPGKRGFARRNFVVAGRYFDLFVESRQPKPGAEGVAELNELLDSLEVRAGDFYRGTIRPPRFPVTPGWHVGSAGGGEVRTTDYAEAWAATVPYLNEPRELPPTRTIETLPADGILIWVGLARDNRYPPTDELRRDRPPVHVPLRLPDAHGCACFEGVPDNWLYRLYGPVGEQYHLDLWVFFGSADEPSAEQRGRAQAMLDGLRLPDWGSWELDGRGTVELAALRE